MEVASKKKQQLLSDQQDDERCRQHAHTQQFARGYLCGQRALECRVNRRPLRRSGYELPSAGLVEGCRTLKIDGQALSRRNFLTAK